MSNFTIIKGLLKAFSIALIVLSCETRDCCADLLQFPYRFTFVSDNGEVLLGNDTSYILHPENIKFRSIGSSPVDIPCDWSFSQDSSVMYISPRLHTFDPDIFRFYIQYGHYESPIFEPDTIEWRVSDVGDQILINDREQGFEDPVVISK